MRKPGWSLEQSRLAAGKRQCMGGQSPESSRSARMPSGRDSKGHVMKGSKEMLRRFGPCAQSHISTFSVDIQDGARLQKICTTHQQP